MTKTPLNLLSRSAAAVMKAGLETLAGAERQGSSLIHAIVGNREPDGNGRPRNEDDMPATAFGQLENFFDQRVARALHALQIPTSDDIHELNERVEALTAQVAKLQAAQVKTSKPDAVRRRTRKTAPRKKRSTRSTAGV